MAATRFIGQISFIKIALELRDYIALKLSDGHSLIDSPDDSREIIRIYLPYGARNVPRRFSLQGNKHKVIYA